MLIDRLRYNRNFSSGYIKLCRRVHLLRYDNDFLYVKDDKEKNEIAVSLPSIRCYERLREILSVGCTLNLLDCAIDDFGVLYPQNIIFEPDFLIEITSLCACIQEYGSSPFTYILNLFKDNTATKHTLLGEAANLFLDECINESVDKPATYASSMAKFFCEYSLQLTTADGIDSVFFNDAKRQFVNIRQTVSRLLSPVHGVLENIYIEPSFFCAALGLQGRMDLLERKTNNIIELKSGKADEFRKKPKEEHVLQMSLYKKILKYNLELADDEICAHLFYSRYPKIIHRECNEESISSAYMLRNEIVSLLYKLADGTLRPLIECMTSDDLNTSRVRTRLWNMYKRSEIEKLLLPIQHAEPLVKEYFYGNISFIAREMRIGKIGGGSDKAKGGFAETWNFSREEKMLNGNIFTGLRIKQMIEAEGVSTIVFIRPVYSDDFFPNFRAGDTVFIYVADDEKACAVNRHVTRGIITAITSKEITFKLRHKQRNPYVFPFDSSYILEHDYLDSTVRSSFRDMHSFLSAPEERRKLVLCERKPLFDSNRRLNGNYGDEYINNIVLKAKQAEELFLLLGPPGTGKTSKALSCMVQEFYVDEKCNILLASFTNRAVDEICQAIENLPYNVDYIRIGNEYACAPEYRHRLLKNVIAECKRREQIDSILQSVRIVVGTVSSVSGRQELFKMKNFDVVIIDEATQILESQLVGLFSATTHGGESAIKKFILIGDPKQLPAVVAQSSDDALIKSSLLCNRGFTSFSVSFFERIYRYYSEHFLPELFSSLYLQGRMHPEVCKFANKYFYSGILKPIPLYHQTEDLLYEKFDCTNEIERHLATYRTKFISTDLTSENNNSKINRNEAKKIAEYVAAYFRLRKKNGFECNLAKEVGIIVPFRSQIAMVTNEISDLKIVGAENIVIDTVERFQGSQRDVIFYGTTISSPDMMELLSVVIKDTDGRLVDRKLNVAVTRARRQMFVFGVPDALSVSPLYSAIIKELG